MDCPQDKPVLVRDGTRLVGAVVWHNTQRLGVHTDEQWSWVHLWLKRLKHTHYACVVTLLCKSNSWLKQRLLQPNIQANTTNTVKRDF